MEIKRFVLSENMDFVMQLYQDYGVPSSEWGYVPVLFIGEKYYVGDTPIIQNIEADIIELHKAMPVEPEPIPETEPVKAKVSLVQLLGLALVDAVNPCELAVLVILMTAILSRHPNKKDKALKAGLAFSSAIFLMYTLFGFLIIFGFKTLVGLADIQTLWFYKVLAVLAIILGLLNLKDAVWYGGGGFIMEVPQKWRPKMKEIIKGTTSTAGAFAAGIIVSFFLTPCTAGPYFVFGGILSNMPFFETLPYLFIYMLVFISPMIAITLITFFGFMVIEDVAGWREKNLKKLHWVAGLLLLGLGFAMLLGWI
ncbi:MAG: hypothetical protein COT90_04180 [Candidatus Diapherotrites archaeon CG10_big_fil_rev_8_21_14_0_10_31_34]|nr:MAG: hypothetical protein COT90_04180 [Candidatus Diapherotrites archaeon CG10_big_fil_rev_8_21_14_0_10_31_34]